MKLWHRLVAWVYLQRAKGQRRQLARFIRESAREICAWRQEIRFLEGEAAFHQAQAAPAGASEPGPDNVVPMKQPAAA